MPPTSSDENEDESNQTDPDCRSVGVGKSQKMIERAVELFEQRDNGSRSRFIDPKGDNLAD